MKINYKKRCLDTTTYALVLAGGGAKGAYQIGVWKALKELKIKIGAVIGNSVGALNGALFIQGGFNQAVDLWQNMSIDKLVSIPKELVKERALNLEGKAITHLKEMQKRFFQNKGLDTAPLKNLLEQYVDEKKIRKKKIDFGIVTYQINDFKPHEIYLDEIEDGLLTEYLLASASIPFVFKSTEIKGKQFVDGGVYDNIPFAMTKGRGYKNIIVVDISGLGINKKPDISGTNVIYIKNSIDEGHILDFRSDFINNFMNLGYLDTLKVFGKIDGIDYFYDEDKKLYNILEKILFDDSAKPEYLKYLNGRKKAMNINEIKSAIRERLLPKFRYNANLIISLAESAALSLNIKRNKLYTFKEFVTEIWHKYCEIEKEVSSFKDKKYNNFFEIISNELKKKDFTQDIKDFFHKSAYEHEKALEVIFGGGNKKPDLHPKIFANFFPNLLAAKIFFVVLKKYFSCKT